MFGITDMEGVCDTSSIKTQNLELSETHRNYLSEIFPKAETWDEMSAVDKMEIQNLFELRKEEIIEATGCYDADLTPMLPEYLFEEFNYPFCDEMEFTHKSEFAVKEFYENDSYRDVPYADANIELRAEYIKDFYANYSDASGYNPPLEFKEMPPNNMGAYNPETNTITLNSRLLENDNPQTAMETILHESRHAFQQYAVDHPWRVTVDPNTIAIWEDNFNYYIRPEWDFEAYKKQPLEADANSYAENVINAGLSYIS